MAERKSLVYLDDVVQRALKDVLVPILGYRDTSLRLGQYTELIEHLRKDVTDLQIPDKSKVYIHENMTQPINIYVPSTGYRRADSNMIENIRIGVEFNSVRTASNQEDPKLIACDILIPGEYVQQNSSVLVPYCISCNQGGKDLKVAYVKILTNPTKDPRKVLQLYFPNVNASTGDAYTRGIVTITSNQRDVRKVDTWDGVTGEEDITVVELQHAVRLGTVPYFDPIEEPENIVRSTNIRYVEGITKGAYTFLDEIEATDPDTLYHERQDSLENDHGTINFDSVEDLQSAKSLLMDIFGKDWSGVIVNFRDGVTDISHAFEGFTFTKTPKQISGKHVKNATGLFKGVPITTITDCATLLRGLPELEYANSAFADTPLTGDIKGELFASNQKLMSIHYCFKNTKITGTANFWDMTHQYTPDRDDSLSSLLPNPKPITIKMDGVGCFEGVTTLPSDLDIPANWKEDTKQYTYETRDEFNLKRGSLLAQYEGDLSEVTLTFNGSDVDLAGLFENTELRKAPKAIVANTTTIARMFNGCSKLTNIYTSTIAQLTDATDASYFTSSCRSLRTYPQDMFAALKKITDFSDAMSYLEAMTGPMPRSGGKQLWELAGTEGYPAEIIGRNCYYESTFDGVDQAPAEWRGGSDA